MILAEQVTIIHHESTVRPPSLEAARDTSAPAVFWAAGPTELLTHPKLGFFCSSQCPGSIILKTFDAITQMRDEGRLLIGGFHSVMEWECLGILLRGRQPIIWVPARSIIGMRLKPELQRAFMEGRLLILSPFPPAQNRITTALAQQRNRFVCALADRIFVPYAAPGSRTAALREEIRILGKDILTLPDVILNVPT